MNDTTQPKRRNLQAWGLFLLFFGPLAVAMFLYYGTDWRPGGTGNHGELVRPPQPTPVVTLPGTEAYPDGDGFLRDRWTLVYVARSPCEEACQEALYNGRQMRLALGRLMDRVERVYLFTTEPPEAGFLAAEHPDLVVVDATGAAGEALLTAFAGQDEGYWLVDPLGNVMMRYPADQTPKGMMEDIKKLLRLSRIG
ncbi:cytochrome oxidase assembly protein [Thioalkalivibrio sp. XN279]|uniref:SCO family protein n=1 Tax=Thioalkalivibrio sp. XN279 TaxID=2714953 RepID=UPI00140D2449|nr:cytochrome oxidase assembly protein [Thioalkalivibrio sp. XN279]NHA14275.1 cytochrome oxidase assembly protein [Thioalkalivibrio sp. XN279]